MEMDQQKSSKLANVLDSIEQGEIQPRELPLRITCDDVLKAIYPTYHGLQKHKYDDGIIEIQGTNASPGAAKGPLALDADTAESWGHQWKNPILVRQRYAPDDVHGILSSSGIVSLEEGATGHAAVVARQFGIPAVVGLDSIRVDLEERRMILDNSYVVEEGEEIAIDGTTGILYISPKNQLLIDFDEASNAKAELLNVLAETVAEVVDKRLLNPEGLELALVAIIIKVSKMQHIADLLQLKPALDYLVEVYEKGSRKSLLMQLLLTTLNTLLADVGALLANKEHARAIQIRKQITLDLSRMNNIGKKTDENRLLAMCLEKGVRHVDDLISAYQKPVDSSEVTYSSPSLLLIDDEPYFVYETIQALQENLHAKVLVATNVEKAVAILASSDPFDLVIADVMLPIEEKLSSEPYQGGLTICRKAREMRGTELPIICLTVVSDPEILKEFKKFGVSLVINKPAVASEVVDAVHRQLMERYRIPDPQLLSSEIMRRQLELRSSDANMRIRALWALFHLGRYDQKIIGTIRDFLNSETDASIKGIAQNIADQLRLRGEVSERTEKVPEAPRLTEHRIAADTNAPNTPFDVFLSHNSVDKEWAVKLKSALEELGIKVWLDKDEIRPGDLFAMALENGLDQSRCVAIIVSPESVASGWVREEYYRALSIANSSSHRLRLIPVLLREAKLPGFLSSRNWVDFRNETHFDDSVKRLVWGITGKIPT